MDAVLDWMTSTWINELVIGYQWTWATLESLHFFGLCLLIGAVLMMDLRLLGFTQAVPLQSVHVLTWAAVLGFVINLVTGVGFLFGDPYIYVANYAFWVKMTLVGVAGLNYLLYAFVVEPALGRSPTGAPPSMLARAVGGTSLVSWLGVLVFGRLLPYLGTGGG